MVSRLLPSPEARVGHMSMLAFSALVAGSFSLGGMAAPFIDPAVLNAVRFVLAAIVMGVLALAMGAAPSQVRRAPWRFMVLGFLFGAYFVLMFEGLKTAPPVSAAAVFTLTPIMTAAFGYIMMRQVLTPRMALALAIGAAGALWVIFRGSPDSLIAFEIGQGEVIYFVGCVSHAAFTPLSRKLNRGETPVVFTFGVLLGGAVLLCLWAGPAALATDWASLPQIVWIALFYIVFFATAASFTALQTATLRLPSSKVMAYTYLTPSWVVLWEIALGHTVPPVIVLGGVALTVLALFLLLKD